jgi:predicted nucleic acid-binding protein
VSDLYKRPYIESSVFIAFIKGEMQGPNEDQDAKEILDSIISAAKAGLFKIVTSSLTIAEVFKKKNHPELTIQQNEDLRPHFREDYIVLVEVDREVGERANELCCILQADEESGFKAMRPNDAIHIAAAEKAECDVVLAWDPHFMSQSKRLTTVKLENPVHVEFVIPPQPGDLFQIGESIESEQQTEAITAAPENLQLVGHVEPNNKAGEVTENSAAVRGDDGERVEGKTPIEAGQTEEKVKGPGGVQIRPAP